MSREMKHSGIPWIGEIPKEWKVKKLKFSCKLFGRIGFRGYTADDLVSESEGAITLSPTNMNGIKLDFTKCSYLSWDKYYESPEIMVEKGDVLLVKTASVGKCSYVDCLPKETTVNPQILVMKEHHDVSKFIAYIFQTSLGEAYIDTTKGGSTIYTISQEKIGNYEFAFPPLSEQQKIASYLDRKCSEIDEMVVLQEKIIEELKAYKQSVITEAVTKGLNPDVPMKDSGIEWIGEIPENWEVLHFWKVNYIRGRLGWKGLKAEEYQEFGYPFLSAFNIINDNLDWRDVNYISKERYDESPEIKLSLGDILIVKDGAGIGKCARVDVLPKGESTVNSSLAVITPNSNVSYRFEYYFLLSKSFQYVIWFLKIGMGVPHLTQENMRDIIMVCPSLSEQQSIASYLDEKCSEIDSLISIKQSKIESLKEYKKSIIYEYVTGKKEVE